MPLLRVLAGFSWNCSQPLAVVTVMRVAPRRGAPSSAYGRPQETGRAPPDGAGFDITAVRAADALLPPRTVHFRAFRDDDADVWIATSAADRLTTEAATRDEIVGRLKAIVPDVLESRHGRIGPLTILIDWQELRTVEQTTLAVV